MLRIYFERGAPIVLVSDQESSFKAVAKDFSKIPEHKEAMKWIDGWYASDEEKYLEKTFGVQFRFQNPESPELNTSVERLQKVITYSMLSLRQADLSLSHIITVVKGLQRVLNIRPLYCSDMEVVTPNYLLTGYDIDINPSFTLPKVNPRLIQSRGDIIRRTKQTKSILARCWSKFILSYVEGLYVY